MPSVSMVVLGECITQKELDLKWRIFPSMLRARNISVVPIRDTSATHFFALEHDDKSLRKIDSIVDVSNRVLVIVEPKTVHPAQHTKKVLDQYGIAVRTGHHCAWPLMKKLNLVGTTRASFHIYNDEQDVINLINAIKKVKEYFKVGA